MKSCAQSDQVKVAWLVIAAVSETHCEAYTRKTGQQRRVFCWELSDEGEQFANYIPRKIIEKEKSEITGLPLHQIYPNI